VPHFAAPPGLFVPAEWQRGVEHVVAIDPHRSGAKLRSQAMRLSNIARPDSCRQSVHGVVRALDHVVIVGEGNCGNHRTENLLAYHLHVFGGIDQHGGFHEIAFVAMTLRFRGNRKPG